MTVTRHLMAVAVVVIDLLSPKSQAHLKMGAKCRSWTYVWLVKSIWT